VGKTTAAVRMALELKQERPDLRIRIINADHARGGGRLLLRNYAELTGMDYREVSGPVDFATAVKEGRNFDKVVVDLPGLERGATFESMEQELGLEVSGDIQVHLAMSPYYSRQQFTSYLHRFFSRSVSSLVWTKLDEAYNFGAVVNTGAETGLPISALSFGAGLKGTLVPAQAAQVWRLIFKHLLPGEPTEPIQ
jgi:flagellar biosynthesis protein FlhF